MRAAPQRSISVDRQGATAMLNSESSSAACATLAHPLSGTFDDDHHMWSGIEDSKRLSDKYTVQHCWAAVCAESTEVAPCGLEDSAGQWQLQIITCMLQFDL